MFQPGDQVEIVDYNREKWTFNGIF